MIRSREDFAGFVRDLRANPGAWENQTLETYLEALTAWGEDMDGYYQNRGEVVPEAPSWKTLGKIMATASIYA